jgi:ABC-type uncharacterized transport system ATPase subunit
MHNGTILREGTPDEIEADAQVHALYMGGDPSGDAGGGFAAY